MIQQARVRQDSQVAERCQYILQATKDGSDLDPRHLRLVELAVNGRLNETGLEAFEELRQQVKAGYRRPWFHGIVNMTIDVDGYVRWQGIVVDHYSSRFCFSDKARDETLILAGRCELMERAGYRPSCNAIIWWWERYWEPLLCPSGADENGGPDVRA